MIKLLSIFILFAAVAINASHAQEKKRTWFEIQQAKVYALKECKELEKIKDSIKTANSQELILSVEREPCDICSKWDLSLRDSNKQYLAFYVIKFKSRNNQIAAITKQKIRKK